MSCERRRRRCRSVWWSVWNISSVGARVADGRLRVGVLRLRALVQERGQGDRGEDPDDQDHDHELDEREAAIVARSVWRRRAIASSTARKGENFSLGPSGSASSPASGTGLARRVSGGSPAAASTSRATARGGVGARQAARRGGHRGQPLGRRRAARRPRRAAAAGVSSASGRIVAAPASVHPAGVGGLVVGGRVRIRDQDRRQAVLGELEHRAAGARDGEVGGGERVAERRHVVAQVRSAARARAARRSRARRATCRTR